MADNKVNLGFFLKTDMTMGARNAIDLVIRESFFYPSEFATSSKRLVSPKTVGTLPKYSPFLGIFNVSVNEETIHFRMYVFHGNLEAVETAGFCDLNFLAKPLHLVSNASKFSLRKKSPQHIGQWTSGCITLPFHFKVCFSAWIIVL